MARTTIGILNVKLNAQTAAFSKGLSKGRKSLFGFKASTLVGVAAMGAFTAGAIRAAKSLGRLTRETAQYGDDLLNTANTIGIATDELEALRFAGRVTSVEMSKLDGGLVKLSRSIGDSIDGNKEYRDTFEKLGLSVEALARMTPDQQLRAFADSLQGLDTDAEKVNAAMTVMGRSGAALLPMLANGSAGLDEFEKRFRSTGAAIDNEGAAKLAAANAELEYFSTAIDGAGRKLGASFAPSLAAVGRTFRELLGEIAPNVDMTTKLRRAAQALIADTLDGIGLIVQGITWLGTRTGRTFAAIIEAAAKANEAIAKVNPVGSVKKAKAAGDEMRSFASDLRSNADTLERINRALSREGLGDRFRRNLTAVNKNAAGFVSNLMAIAGLQREIGRQQELATSSRNDQFEQVVRSRIAIGGVSGGTNYAMQTVQRLDTLIAINRAGQRREAA